MSCNINICQTLAALQAQKLNVTKKEIIAVYASAHRRSGTTEIQRNCTITENGLGRYTVTFSAPHPDGFQYEVLLGQEESGAFRDVPKVSVVFGSKTANGFDIQVTLDDNGGTADTYSNDEWSFAVLHEVNVITNVTLT